MRKDIEPDPREYSAFIDFVEKIDDHDPSGLDKMTSIEKLQRLDTKEEKIHFQASLFAFGILQEVKSSFASSSYIPDGEINATRLSLKVSDKERGFITQATNGILNFMLDHTKIGEYFESHEIERNAFDFDLIKYDGGFMKSHDSQGMENVLTTALEISNVELDRRLTRPFSRENSWERFKELKTKTFQDLTGVTYLDQIYLPKLQTVYLDTLEEMKAVSLRTHEDIVKMIYGLSYPSALFTVDMYSEIVGEYLEIVGE